MRAEIKEMVTFRKHDDKHSTDVYLALGVQKRTYDTFIFNCNNYEKFMKSYHMKKRARFFNKSILDKCINEIDYIQLSDFIVVECGPLAPFKRTMNIRLQYSKKINKQ